MKKTDNYSLPQWEKQDFIKMEDFNDAFGKTDAALKANADATATGLNAETAARGEAIAAEAENRSTALAALQASLAAAIGSGGKTCRIFTGSYTGTGRSGSGNPTVIVTGFRPLVLVLTSKNGTFVRIRHTDATFADHDFSGGNVSNQMTWGTDRISWYNTVISSANERQANESGVTYYYLVLGCDAA